MNVIKTAIDGVVILEPHILKMTGDISLNLLIRGSLRKKYARLHLSKIMKVNRVMVYFVVYIFNRPLLLRVNWCV